MVQAQGRGGQKPREGGGDGVISLEDRRGVQERRGGTNRTKWKDSENDIF